MNRILAAVALASVAGLAQAQTQITFDLEVSLDGITWSENVNVGPGGGAVQVRLVQRGLLNGSADIIGLPGGTAANFPVTNTSASDTISALTGRFAASSPASDINLRNAGAANAALDRATLSNNITFQNLAPNFGGVAGNDVVFMTFTYNVAASADRVLTLDTGTTSNIAIYTTAGGSNTTAQTVRDGATITQVVPAPGALAMLGLGGLAAGRRRRA